MLLETGWLGGSQCKNSKAGWAARGDMGSRDEERQMMLLVDILFSFACIHFECLSVAVSTRTLLDSCRNIAAMWVSSA